MPLIKDFMAFPSPVTHCNGNRHANPQWAGQRRKWREYGKDQAWRRLIRVGAAGIKVNILIIPASGLLLPASRWLQSLRTPGHSRLVSGNAFNKHGQRRNSNANMLTVWNISKKSGILMTDPISRTGPPVLPGPCQEACGDQVWNRFPY